ncbi:MAG: hypothetical protein H6606_00685 [Flavobacteriales bacterium]|nr:hypothetical protein [Flavobacteriales bacterium]
MKAVFISFVLALTAIWGCTEVQVVEPVPGGPLIEYVDIQPRTIREFADSITITIRYKDPDGDLGHTDPDINLISVQDLRLAKADTYHVPLLAPSNSRISIEGTLEVKLQNTFLLGSGASEQTSYELILTDRAGNKSNPVLTDPVAIIRE